MSDDEQKLIEEAEHYIKDHKQELISRFADPKIYIPAMYPVSVFMAGSPGAGKTEFSKRLIDNSSGKLPVRIDSDDIRSLFPNYTGSNSSIFQPACTT
ncbi:MAG: zeta toxin family protein, partial [Sedimentisphaerales bacterium]|nr:zeta toxin family protein [Sedimentisphaerales bacterium]